MRRFWILNHYATTPATGPMLRHYYFADCLRLYRGISSYEEIINTERITMSLSSFNVKAIIKTNYREKYNAVIEAYEKINAALTLKERTKLVEELQMDPLFLEFYNDLVNKFSVCYFIDGDFEQKTLAEIQD